MKMQQEEQGQNEKNGGRADNGIFQPDYDVYVCFFLCASGVCKDSRSPLVSADGSFISVGFSIQSVSSEALGYLPGSVCRI